MSEGLRFKNRLPRFVGKIPDMEDLFIAEDKEFEKIDDYLLDFKYSLVAQFIGNIKEPEHYLRKLEIDYGLPHVGSVEKRVKNILVKKKAKRTTTEDVLLELIESLGYTVTFTERYREYGFTLNFYNPRDFNSEVLLIVNEVKPAHLEFDVRIIYQEEIIYADKGEDYRTKYWFVNEVPSGRIHEQSYKGVINKEVVKVANSSRIADNRPKKTNEYFGGEMPKTKGGNL